MSGKVRSECMGIVYKVLVEVGQQVKAQDTIILLESMKTEVPIQAEFSGKIQSIAVSEGDPIDEGQLLVTIE